MVVCFVVFDDVCRADGVEDVGQSEMVGTGAVKSEKLFVGLAMGCTCEGVGLEGVSGVVCVCFVTRVVVMMIICFIIFGVALWPDLPLE